MYIAAMVTGKLENKAIATKDTCMAAGTVYLTSDHECHGINKQYDIC